MRIMKIIFKHFFIKSKYNALFEAMEEQYANAFEKFAWAKIVHTNLQISKCDFAISSNCFAISVKGRFKSNVLTDIWLPLILYTLSG